MKLLVDVDQIRSWEVSKEANIPIITYGFHSFWALDANRSLRKAVVQQGHKPQFRQRVCRLAGMRD